MRKRELLEIDMENLMRLKKRLRLDISTSDDILLREYNKEYLGLVGEVINEKKVNDMNLDSEDLEDNIENTDGDINEDPINEGDGGSGAAMANAGTVSGMGNVSSAQPASIPGAAVTGDGTTGSGDIGVPLGVYTKKGITGDKYIKHSKSGKKTKSKKIMSDVANFLKTHKKGGEPKYGNVPENAGGKLMNYENFIKDQTVQVKQDK